MKYQSKKILNIIKHIILNQGVNRIYKAGRKLKNNSSRKEEEGTGLTTQRYIQEIKEILSLYISYNLFKIY